MTDKMLVLTTAGSEEEARKIGRVLVERLLAACVNIVPRVKSIYRWEGEIEEAEEWPTLETRWTPEQQLRLGAWVARAVDRAAARAVSSAATAASPTHIFFHPPAGQYKATSQVNSLIWD